MKGMFPVKRVLRGVPIPLLREYLTSPVINIGADLPWQYLTNSRQDVTQLWESISTANESTFRDITQAFTDIDELADDHGLQVILDAASASAGGNDALLVAFEKMQGFHEKVFWVWRTHEPIFNLAQKYAMADNVTTNRWHTTGRLPGLDEPNVSDEALLGLQDAISRVYKARGEGPNCIVDKPETRNGEMCLFVTQEGHVDLQKGFNDSHQFEHKPFRVAYEIVFRFHLTDRTLEVYHSKGNAEIVKACQIYFAKYLLEIDLINLSEQRPKYDLIPLRDRNALLALEPEDGVEEVRIRALCLQLIGAQRHELTLRTKGKAGARDVYDFLETLLSGQHLPFSAFELTRVTVQLVFRATGTKTRKPTRTFDITPTACSLRASPKDEVAKLLLKRWKINVSATITEDAGSGRPIDGQTFIPV
ncbi:MAG: hypothetical protein ACYDBB_01325 [Armatimonadota bacterium]